MNIKPLYHKFIAVFFLLNTMGLIGNSRLNAALILDVTDITSNQLTFNLTGTLSGTTPGSTISLFFEAQNNSDWILGPSSTGGIDTGSASASPIVGNSVNNLRLFNDHPLYEDAFQLRHNTSLQVGDQGSGSDVVFTLPVGYSFDIGAIDALVLSWGQIDPTLEPNVGVFQSLDSTLTAVPEPSSSSLFFLSLISLGFLRRRFL